MRPAVYSRSFTFAPRKTEKPKTWKSEIPPRVDLLEIGPEWRRFRRRGAGDAERETTRVTANLAAWDGESGRGRHLARKVAEVREGRRGGISEFQRADMRETGRERVESALSRYAL